MAASSPARWLRVRVPAHGAEAEEIAYRLAEEAGALGAEIAEAGVVAYFPESRDAAEAEREVREIAGAEARVDWIEAEPWAERWREHFRPQRIGRLRVTAPWHERPAEPGVLDVVVNPGAAFGTGTHETTRLCLEILQDLDLGAPPPSFNPWVAPPGGGSARMAAAGPSVLDVGTGSGILALAARRLGAGRVVGVEIDETAALSARENAALSGLAEEIAILAGGPERAAGAFDLVLGNLILGTLLDLRDALVARVRPGGRLLLSGLLHDQAREAEDAYGLPVLERRRLGEWIALLLAKPGP